MNKEIIAKSETLSDKQLEIPVIEEKNDFKEIEQLVHIRNYVYNSINNSNITKDVVKKLSGILLLLDRKIIELLQSPDFCKYINYNDIDTVIQQAAKLNNIKSGIVK